MKILHPSKIFPITSLKYGLSSLFTLLTGIGYIFLYEYGVLVPLEVSIGIAGVIALFIFTQFRKSNVGILTVFCFVTFLLPFVHLLSYINYDFTQPDPSTGFGGIATNPYTFDQKVIQLTAMIGTLGSLGIAFFLSINNDVIFSKKVLPCKPQSAQSLSRTLFLVWTFTSLILALISAPPQTVLESGGYGHSIPISSEVNFGSAWLVSYIVLTFALVDALLDLNKKSKRFKLRVILFVSSYMVIWLQVFRGDRESFTWVLAVLMLITYWSPAPEKLRARLNHNMGKIVGLIILLLVISSVVGILRDRLPDTGLSQTLQIFQELSQSGALSMNLILDGTWSAVLLTPLSISGDQLNNILEYRNGKDYIDLLLSLPPGFVSDLFGYTRPLSATAGPAWTMTYGLGGVHLVVVPFTNFRMIGVFLIPGISFYFIRLVEQYSLQRLNVYSLSTLTVIAMTTPHWFWYGDKYIFNAIIATVITSSLYGSSLRLSRST